jgi:hypothetical protein
MGTARASVWAAVGVCAGAVLFSCGGEVAPGELGAPAADSSAGAGVDLGAGAGVGAAHQALDAGSAPAPPASAAHDARFACDPSASSEPEALRRLTMTQYANTLHDLARWAVGDGNDAATLVASAGLDALPRDRRLDQALDQLHVDTTYRVAAALATGLTEAPRLGRVAGACAVDADPDNDDSCLSSFLQRFGARALRRPLDAGDETFYRAVYGSDPTASAAAYADVITVLLSAPELLYFVEHGEGEPLAEAETYALSPHELASRLSYHFWQTLPDEELWQAAEDRSLLEPDVLARQVERLMGDPRTRTTLNELFAEILQLDALPALDAHLGDPVFVAFAGSDLPGPELRGHAIDEALAMLSYFTWTAPSGVEALLTSDLSFARGEDLAQLYGVAPWDGSSAPPALAAGTRPGLLTRAWLLASGSASTRPIKRGVFVRRQLLCDELPPPPVNVAALLPEPRTDMTTRQSLEALTEQPGTACAGCHATSINPLGFAFEGFDALARARTEQRLFEDDGRATGALPIDTRSVPRVSADDTSVSSGPTDLARLMLDSGKVEACLARHYFRFAFGRQEDLTVDGCALERLRARLVESGRIRDMLAAVASLPELGYRRFGP